MLVSMHCGLTVPSTVPASFPSGYKFHEGRAVLPAQGPSQCLANRMFTVNVCLILKSSYIHSANIESNLFQKQEVPTPCPICLLDSQGLVYLPHFYHQ